MKLNAVSVKNITRKKTYVTPQTRWKVWDIYNATVQLYNSHEYPYIMEYGGN